MGLWFYDCQWLVVSDLVYLCLIGVKNPSDCTCAVTTSPTDEWTAQQVREATPWGESPKYILHDRDSKYGPHFSAVASGSGIKELRTPYRTPQANGVCERFMGSLCRECLDHMLILQGRQLKRVASEYTNYFNQARPHQGIRQQIPIFYDKPRENSKGRITSKAIFGGLHRSYSRVV